MTAVSQVYRTITELRPTFTGGQLGNKREFVAQFTWGDNGHTYVTGGHAIVAADLNVTTIASIDVWIPEDTAMEGTTKRDGRCVLDRENSKLTLINAAGSACSGDVGAWVSRVYYVATEK